ncbi:MAG: response regulator transcription factor [Deltaproteobacteria bacterium]|nr:response regulator transcription factor [Deltaproteobacteria bacterium]
MVGPSILIIEDEQDLVRTLEYSLQHEGFHPRTALTGAQGIEIATQEPVPDLILLDIMLPDIAGTEVCRRLRSLENTKYIPIVMATAKGEEIDRVVGFELGADDYVTKPYSIRELILRLRVLLRRKQFSIVNGPRITLGRLRVDVQGHRVWIDEQETIFTTLEFKLLWKLIERRGRVQSRETLLTDVWGINAEVTTRTVDTHIMRVRHKLGVVQEYIETLRGVGYRFREQIEQNY